MLPQQLLVNAGANVKALRKSAGVQIAQVPVSLFVAAQKDQMIHGSVQLMDPVGAASGGHIDLTAKNGLDALCFAGFVKVHHTIHNPVVGDGNRWLAQLLDPLDQQGNAAGPIQQRKLGMDVQVDKGHRETSFCKWGQPRAFRWQAPSVCAAGG